MVWVQSNKNKPYVFFTVYVFRHNISGTWRAGMIIVSEGKVEAKIVKDEFAAGHTSTSGQVLRYTCVIQTETKARKRGSKQETEKERLREGNNEC
jgi:hypothetical protein